MERKIERCSNCVLPSSLPSVTLDRDGVCGQCRDYARRVADWEATKDRRSREFGKLVQIAKDLKRPYDCLVPFSGGKDSTYALYLCSKVYGMKCRAVTWDNGYLSEQAKRNIKRAAESARADHSFFTIDRRTLLDLYRTFQEKAGLFCPACMRGIHTAVEITARKYRVPLVVFGGGARLAYLAFHPELGEGGSVSFCRNVLKGHSINRMLPPEFLQSTFLCLTTLSKLLYNASKINEMLFALPVNIYDYVDVKGADIYKTVHNEMGWEKLPDGQFEHMDCSLHRLPGYIHTLKFHDLSMNTIYTSALVRRGEMTREEGLRICSEELAHPRVPEELEPFLHEIGMGLHEFYESVSDWRRLGRFTDKRYVALRTLYHKVKKYS